MSQEKTAIQKSVLIDLPPEEVWSFIADPRNDTRWCPKVESVEQVRGNGPGSDAAYRVIHRPVRLKKAKPLAVTVEEFQPSHRMRLREEDDDAVFEVTYALEPMKGGTHFTQADQIVWKIPRFQYPIARRMVSRDIQSQLAALKRLMEAT